MIRIRSLARIGLPVGVPVAALAAASGLVWVLEEAFGLSDASTAYLLAVTAVAVLSGTLPAIATAGASFLAYNFLFTHPRFTFIVADTTQLLNLVLLLVVGVVVGQLAGAQRTRAQHAEEREREARVLFQVSRALASRSDTPSALREIVQVLRENTGFADAWIGLGSSPGAERPLTPLPAGMRVPSESHVALQRRPGDEPARWMRVVAPTRGARGDDTRTLTYRVPIEGGAGSQGSLWATRAAGSGEPPRHETRMLAAAADQVGLALEHDRLRSEAISAELARESEAMKSALLESVSHDLRTPLAAIRASAGALLEQGPGADAGLREQALAIDAEAARMNRLVGNLLEISRIEAGGLTVDLQPYDLADLLGASLRRFEGELAGRLQVMIPADLPYVAVDAILLDQAVANVVENSVRYAPGAELRVSAGADGEGTVRLAFEDSGPGVPADALNRLFDKFYRVRGPRDPARRGTGIGLAVVRGSVLAMGGTVEALPSPLGGLAVIMHLPVAELPDDEDQA